MTCRNVILLSVGTRGDVEPFCALAKELLLLGRSSSDQQVVDDNTTNTESKQQQQQQQRTITTTTTGIDFFIQQNHEHFVRPLLLGGNRSNFSSSRNRPLRIHTFPFTNQDYYNVPTTKRHNYDDYEDNCHQKHLYNDIINDPRMSSVSELADIVGGLVLPAFDQVETVVLEHLQQSQQKNNDCNSSNNNNNNNNNNRSSIVIVTTALARPLAFLLAKIYHRHIKVVVVHLQPLLPNPIFPSYRVSVPNFVRSIMNFVEHHDESSSGKEDNEPNSSNTINSDNINEVEETYWRLEYAMEICFLRRRIVELGTKIQLRHEKQHKQLVSTIENNIDDVDSSFYFYYSWKELKTILSGHHDRFTIINAYSNQLVPRLDNTFVGPNKVYDVGPLADSYLPPGKPSVRLTEFLNNAMMSPICIGFGSMAFPKPTTILVDALFELNHPGILVGSSLRDYNHQNQLERQDCCDSYDRYTTFVREKIYHLDFIPHAYILPYCSMMLCHGGSGVVNACLRSGTPCLIAPVLGDQFAWASLIQAKGFGIQVSTTLQDLTKDDIKNAIQKVSDPSSLIVNNARRVSEQHQKLEDKVGSSLLAAIIKQL